MKPWLLKSILVIAVFAIAWIAALYYWQTSHRVPNGADIGIYFFAIPLGVLLTIWLGTKSWKAVKNRASSSSSETSGTESSHTKVDEKEPLFAAILSSAVYMQHGKSSDELLKVVKDNSLELNLDSELVNEDGFPILSMRISDLDEESQRTLLSDWEEDNQRIAASWRTEHIRAIALATEVIKQLVDEALKHPLLGDYLDEENPQQQALIALPSLTLSFIHSENWEQDICDEIQAWFIAIVTELGWPEEKLTIRLYPQKHFSQAAKLIEKIIADSASQSLSIFNLMVSATSFIDQAAIDSWPSQLTRLFGDAHHPVSIPSEGAAGLLLADAATATLFDSSSKTMIHQPWFVEMDTHQQISDTERKNILAELVNYALEKSRLTAEKIKFVSSDTNSYSKKLVELFNLGLDVFPELDAAEHYFSSSNQCGIIGTSASLLALAIAHEAVKQEDEAAIFISHMDHSMRAVTIIDKYKDVEPPEDVETSDDNPSQS